MTLERERVKQLTGQQLLRQLVVERQSYPPFVKGVYDAARLQYEKTRAMGRKEILMRGILETDFDYKDITTIIANTLGKDNDYQLWNSRAQKNESLVGEVRLAVGYDSDSAAYYEGHSKAQSILGRYISEDRATLLKAGKKIASVYPMFMNGTERFFADLAEITGNPDFAKYRVILFLP